MSDMSDLTDLADLLGHADIEVIGRLPEASNLTLLCEARAGERSVRCVYKPVAGERPLWDFPGAVLAAREVLTAHVARAFDWDLVPVTVLREDGPGGSGMVQEWVEVDVGRPPVGVFGIEEVADGWLVIAEGHTPRGERVVVAHEPTRDLQRMVVLDALVNNGDRKGGHVLRRADGSVVGIDHGVTFHAETKLRTVLWGWAGEDLPAWLVGELERGAGAFAGVVEDHAGELSPGEAKACLVRLDRLLRSGTFPTPSGDWPALPWPPM